jgi:hypothetical protein
MFIKGEITERHDSQSPMLPWETWRFVEARLYRYMSKHRTKPLALVVHPLMLEQLLNAIDSVYVDLDLLDGVSIQTDERCNVLHVIDRYGQLRKL